MEKETTNINDKLEEIKKQLTQIEWVVGFILGIVFISFFLNIF